MSGVGPQESENKTPEDLPNNRSNRDTSPHDETDRSEYLRPVRPQQAYVNAMITDQQQGASRLSDEGYENIL